MTDGTRARLGDAIVLRLRDALAERYELLDELGHGGMATVYVAHDRKHDREVALKVMDPSLARGVGAARFLREVRIAATLTHPGIVPVFDSGEVEDTFYYVMPLLRGASLRARLQEGPPITTREACLLLAEVADALDAAHRANVVHRDVKPENILLTDGRPLVTDFGVAHAAHTWFGESLTDTGTAVGTLLYMAPEQLFGERDVDGRADVFSVGAMLYEMLSGKPPFAAATMPAAMARLASEPTPSLPDSVQVSPAVRDVVARATARDRDERYATSRGLADALRAAAMDERAPTTIRPLASPERRRAPRAALVGVAIGLVLVAGTAVILARARSAASDEASAHPSLAVLSFENATRDPKLAYFSDGVAQELQSALADVAGLRVASRTAADVWRGRSAEPREIARALGVSDLLEGAVARTADSVRIYVRLVDGRTGEQRWTRKYDRKLADVFDVQEEVARAVVKELRIALAGGGAPNLVRARTLNTDAHDLVLRANYESRSLQRAGLERAAVLLDSALALDSSYAPAWARKARVLNYLAIFRDRTSPDVLREARVAAERAATLDSLSADAQTSLGVLLFRYDWRWAEAERHLRRAIALNPAYVEARLQLARVMRSLGRFDEARAQLVEIGRIDPTTANMGMSLGRVSYFARDYDRAIRETRGSSPSAREYATWLSDAYIAKGRYAEAESVLVHDSTGGPQLALVRAATGRAALARASAATGERTGSWHDEELAEVYTALGERDRALTLLEHAVDQHDALVVDFLVRPRLDPLRNEPRFQALMRRLAFPGH